MEILILVCRALRRSFGWFLIYSLVGGIWLSPSNHAMGAVQQSSTSAKVDTDLARRHLEAGEYPRVLELLPKLSQHDADSIRAELFAHQLNSGATNAAALTVLNIADDNLRRDQLSRLHSRLRGVAYRENSSSSGDVIGNSPPPGGGSDTPASSGAPGGITENDFQPLMDLIRNTIAKSKWSDDGGPFSIRAYPAGVYVDHSGSLQRMKVDSSRFSNLLQSTKQQSPKLSWSLDSGNRDPQWKSELRKVSLTRLEQAASLNYSMGIPFDDAMLNLAGMTEIRYVFIDIPRREIVLAGPAGPWHFDSVGRAINSETGKPVLRLEDFVVTLRNAFEQGGRFGCSIEPRAENLAAVQQLVATGNIKGGQAKKKLRDTLGQQDIVVFGMDAQTHAARVLVEADYHMKLVGMGLERSIAEVPSYLDRLKLRSEDDALPNDVVRWWFTTKESDLACDQNFEMFHLAGAGVRVLSESEILRHGGERVHTGRASGPAQGFAHDFTKHFSQMAHKYTVYQELQNLFSLALVANLIRQQQLDSRTGRSLSFFKSASENNQLAFPVRRSSPPRQVDTVMNEKVLEYRRANSTVRNTILAISGGVEFDSSPLLQKDRLKPTANNEENESIKAVTEPAPQNWWWD